MINKKSIFLHTLFRSSGTFITSLFDNLDNFTIYSEPENEGLDTIFKNKIIEFDPKILRHSVDSNFYTSNYILRSSELSNFYTKDHSYKNFFEYTKLFDSYLKAIINTNKTPVLKFTKSAGRIKEIKESIDGFHVYIRRNPHSQFWSCLQANYTFLPSVILIMSSPYAPAFFYKALAHVGISPINLDNIDVAFESARKIKLNFVDSFYLFLLLWLYYDYKLEKNCDYVINIDKLNIGFVPNISEYYRLTKLFGIPFSRLLHFKKTKYPHTTKSKKIEISCVDKIICNLDEIQLDLPIDKMYMNEIRKIILSNTQKNIYKNPYPDIVIDLMNNFKN